MMLSPEGFCLNLLDQLQPKIDKLLLQQGKFDHKMDESNISFRN